MRRRIIGLGLTALMALPLAVQPAAHAVAIPNAGFETSPTDPTGDTTSQPTLPTGWIFEGAAGLFDYPDKDNPFSSEPYRQHGGQRWIAISDPASTARQVCQQNVCEPNPLNTVKDAAKTYYNITPYWRTQNPISVSAGHSYTFSVWSRQTLATVGVGGAITAVRWVDVNGLPIRQDAGDSHIQTAGDAATTNWKLLSKAMVAPSGATGAILLLGAADDLFISGIAFDDVSFV